MARWDTRIWWLWSLTIGLAACNSNECQGVGAKLEAARLVSTDVAGELLTPGAILGVTEQGELVRTWEEAGFAGLAEPPTLAEGQQVVFFRPGLSGACGTEDITGFFSVDTRTLRVSILSHAACGGSCDCAGPTNSLEAWLVPGSGALVACRHGDGCL
ncbi:MAG: hypothetical protein V4850_07815 [Myxococcota bacterium]